MKMKASIALIISAVIFISIVDPTTCLKEECPKIFNKAMVKKLGTLSYDADKCVLKVTNGSECRSLEGLECKIWRKTHPKSEEEVDQFCLEGLEFVNCWSKIVNECMKDTQISSNFDRLRKFYEDICSKNSLLKDILDHRACIFGKFKDEVCLDVQNNMTEHRLRYYKDILEDQNLQIPKIAYHESSIKECIVSLKAYTCFSSKILWHCGAAAKNAYTELYKVASFPNKCNSEVLDDRHLRLITDVLVVSVKDEEKDCGYDI